MDNQKLAYNNIVCRRHDMCLVLLLVVIRLDVVEAELVDVLRGSDDTGRHVSPNVHKVKVEKLGVPNPVTEGVLLQELFGEVLEVPLGEGDVRSHSDGLVA